VTKNTSTLIVQERWKIYLKKEKVKNAKIKFS